MVESTTQQQTGSETNLDPAQTQKRYVMIIGSCGHGKSTFKNALIDRLKNIASDATTKDFQCYSSIFHELTDTIFIDSPGLNET
jgi:GTPase Era involved in 16S rRNA processing